MAAISGSIQDCTCIRTRCLKRTGQGAFGSDGRRPDGSAPSETGQSMYKCFLCLAFEHAKICVSVALFSIRIAKCLSDRRVARNRHARNTKRSGPLTVDLAGTAVKLATWVHDLHTYCSVRESIPDMIPAT
ncbi:hypothetical protein F4824DRAFT_360282 [Ustulina deusta]|nr:hypothetical protein F4823DRAFT_228922 [Ustulina deusta]KAI3340976.1 hypothetical protein F4824DRAFT_360282 [Ustulina deusta]